MCAVSVKNRPTATISERGVESGVGVGCKGGGQPIIGSEGREEEGTWGVGGRVEVVGRRERGMGWGWGWGAADHWERGRGGGKETWGVGGRGRVAVYKTQN